jgi:hypothetical protein
LTEEIAPGKVGAMRMLLVVLLVAATSHADVPLGNAAEREQARREAAELRRLELERVELDAALAKKAEREAAMPKPRLIDGQPVMGMALVEDKIAAVAEFDDGEWRDPNDMQAVEAEALLSDPNAKPVVVSAGGWFQPIKRSYRGKEGWQKLRWGMTPAEVSTTLGKVSKVKPSEGLQLAWAWKIGETAVVVEAIFVTGRLGGVLVRVPGNSFDTVKSLVIAKYGEPSDEEFLNARWKSPESMITLKLLALTPTVLYMSKVFAVLGVDQMTRLQKKQADEGL